MPQTHLIIGTSAAGLSAALTLRKLDSASDILCISDEVSLPYNKCFLVSYLIDQSKNIFTATQEMLRDQRIELLLGSRVTAINPHDRSVCLATGEQLFFTTLCIGTGASAYIPPIFRKQTMAGIFTFYTLQETHAMTAYMKEKAGGTVAIIGAGLTGLECADALASKGYRVHVIDRGSHGLANLMESCHWSLIEKRMRKQGIQFHWWDEVHEIMGDQWVNGIMLASGQRINTDMVIIATGIRATTELAQKAGIEIGKTGILTTDSLETSIPGIYAGGDVASIKDLLSGEQVPSCLWNEAIQQGRIAAHGMAGNPQTYPGVARITKTRLSGMAIASCGPIASWQGEVVLNKEGNVYLIENNVLKGFLTLGENPHLAELRRLVLSREGVVARSLGNLIP